MIFYICLVKNVQIFVFIDALTAFQTPLTALKQLTCTVKILESKNENLHNF